MATRQRQVFPRDTVAHMWAHKAQDQARDPSGNFYFTGPTLYSYGSHFVIAHILADECGPDLAGRVLWNDSGYSKTTSKMKWIAWRALTGQQKDRHLSMPESIGMGRNVDPHRIERDLIAKRLPDVTPLLINRVIECVSELAKKRYGSGPFESLISKARQAETLALAFYARAKKKYPLALIDTRPVSSNKAEWAAWIKAISVGKMRKDYAEQVKQAKHYAEQARVNAANCTDGFPYFDHTPGQEWEAHNIISGTYDAAQKAIKHIGEAKRLYALLNGLTKKPVALLQLEKEMQPIAALFLARRDEFRRSETRNRLIWDIREAAKLIRRLKAPKQSRFLASRRQASDLETFAHRAKDCGLTDPLYLGLAKRYARIGAAYEVRDNHKRAIEQIKTAENYMPGFPSDALRHAMDASSKLNFMYRLDVASAMLTHLGLQNREMADKAAQLVAGAKALITAREADKLRAWLANESNVQPAYEAGTFARINGDVIETTRGATVPIAHACRLSRMYAIAVRRGGNEWDDGAGPIVGHYRVNKIGSDGSLIIGCHEFSPDEAKRLHALLQSCEACANVTDEVPA